ncbi:MAG: hypothetical protein ACYTHJ_12530 [Planctomycetota bacterium]|jgi:hypothetical protein
MRSVVGLVILLAIGVAILSSFLGRQMAKDYGHQLAVGFADAGNENMQVQLGVGPMLHMRDPLDRMNEKMDTWPEWIALHFQLHTPEGEPMKLRKMGTSALFLDNKAAGSPDFVLYADVEKGREYTFYYTPVVAEAKKYICKFNVPEDQTKVTRLVFELVEDDES